MKNKIGSALFLLLLGLSVGCAQQDTNKIKDRAELERQGASEAEQKANDAKALAMEEDLSVRHRFYQSLGGIYEGTFTTAAGSFVTRLKLVPSLPKYTPPDRVRTPEEIASDINNLYFNVQILHWNPELTSSAAGCVFEAVRGDLEKGQINLVRAECANTYLIRLLDQKVTLSKPGDLEKVSSSVAQNLLAGKQSSVESLRIIMQPSNNSTEYPIDLKRIEK